MRVTDLRGRGWEVSREIEKEIFKVDLAGGSILLGGVLLFFWFLLIVQMPEQGLPVIQILPWYIKAFFMIVAVIMKRWGWLALTILLALPWGLVQFSVYTAPLWFVLLAFGSQSWSISAYCDDGEEWEGYAKGYLRSFRIINRVRDSLEKNGVPEQKPKVLVRVDS